MMAHSGTKSGGLLGEGESQPANPTLRHDDSIYSPPSNYSTYSGEVKYIFDPDYQSEDDYSQVATIRRRLDNWQQAASNSGTRSVDYPQTVHHTYNAAYRSARRPTTANYCNTQDIITPPGPALCPRRRTWSPPPFGSKMGVGGSVHGMRSYHSNDQLDTESHHVHIYEDLESGPPRIAPISGMLAKTPGKGIIRPIAFKPVIPSRYASTPNSHLLDRSLKLTPGPASADDGYGSQDYRMVSNQSNLSQSSIHGDSSDRSMSFSSDGNGNTSKQNLERPESFVSLTNLSRLSSHMEGYVQTPSPSDSGVGELEAMLRERDAEINTLREVMDKNERAIFQVYEEKKLAWEMEISKIKEECDRHLKLQQRRAFKAEQLLMLQIYKLQQEKRSMKDELDKILAEKNVAEERCRQFEDESSQLKKQMEESKWQTHQKSGEIVHVKQQLKDTKDDLNQKSSEVLTFRSQLRDCHVELEQAQKELLTKDREITTKEEELRRLRSEYNSLLQETRLERSEHKRYDSPTKERTPDKLCVMATCMSPPVSSYKSGKSPSPSAMETSSNGSNTDIVLHELDKAKADFESYKAEFEKEREQWLEEKNKVIRYQKQLQLNYVQMFRKNRMLEAEVEQLSLELENRDMKLLALNGEESVC